MVSFSCEVCNDVLTKKKVDNHRSNSCRGATFTCLDCMQHFIGTEYRSHTSCVSEAQKYQGALYNDRKSKSSRAFSSSVHRSASVPRKAYVEDVPDDPDNDGAIIIVEAPPPAPSPPSAPIPQQSQPQQPAVNVFDFLVNDDTPNGSRTTFSIPEPDREPMSVGRAVPSPPPVIVEASPRRLEHIIDQNESRETFGESQYAETGYHYGDGPVPVVHRRERYTYLTPASNHQHHRLAAPRDDGRDDGKYRNGDGGQQHSKHRKRKRVQVEDLQIERIRSHSIEGDQIMTDAPPMLHTGLTGGLKGLLTRTASDYPPSPNYSSDGGGAADRGEPSPGSPLKRSKRHTVENPMTALVSTRRRSTADGHHHVPRLHRHHSSTTHHHRRHHRHHRHSRHQDDETGERPSRKLKTIKYRGEEDGESPNENNNHQQLVLYRSRVELFMSFIKKGPESEKGCSMNKALKRYHRERLVNGGGGMSKAEEEKELWKSLRLRKNERGEIVLFAAASSAAVIDEAGMMSS